jgi:hypothetical protein
MSQRVANQHEPAVLRGLKALAERCVDRVRQRRTNDKYRESARWPDHVRGFH